MFLLGAGASVEAGVPDTYDIVEQFRKDIVDDANLRETVGIIVTKLEEWLSTQQPDQRLDVELLLETLDRLRYRDQDVLLSFYKTSGYLLERYAEKTPMIDRLRDFIKRKAIVDATKLPYMEPLLQFIQHFPSLEIFSVNYDTAIEQFCSFYKIEMTDGFDFKWNRNSFDTQGKIRLYKLHGSITWYRTDSGDHVKIPVKVDSDTIELVTNERARSLILYPMRKWQYTEPLLELLMLLKDRLEHVKCCIVVGYSFRDEHITRIFLDAGQKNRSLHLILVGPHAPEIYRERLRFYKETAEKGVTIPSSLYGRVVCLPYKFGTIFPRLKHLQQELDNGLGWEDRARVNKLIGISQEYFTSVQYAIQSFVDAEHVDKLDQLFSESLDWDGLNVDWKSGLPWSFKTWFNSISRRNKMNPPKLWAARFLNVFSMFDPKNVELTAAAFPKVELSLRIGQEQWSPNLAWGIVRQLAEWSELMLQFLKEDADERQVSAAKGLRELASFFAKWEKGPIHIEQYIATLGDNEKDIRSQLESAEKSSTIAVIMNTERSRLKTICSFVESTINATGV